MTMARLIGELENPDIEIVGFLEARGYGRKGAIILVFLVFTW
jgi:hypothetical protein